VAESPLSLFTTAARSEWVRLRTLINLRWLAIGGQTAAVLFATFQLDIVLQLSLCFLAIGASVIFNVASTIVYPENKRLSERETMLTLLFDLAQLIFLLFLTGGLNNPFALLILAPVTISATALRQKSTVFLGLMAIFLISVVANFHLPLRTEQGFYLRMPDIFVSGFWISLVIGIIFLAGYARRVTLETHSMSQALIATQMALSREQKLTDLGGVVAAAAHELGTPLATIKLVSTELVEELGDHPELLADAALIREQADRCRDILSDMGRTGKDDSHLKRAPLSTVIHEAAEPHQNRGKQIHFSFTPLPDGDPRQPQIQRLPEIIHGVRNLIQNAVDFAEAEVWVDVTWSKDEITLIVADDGRGYPPDLIGRIGDPFVRRRKEKPSSQRPGYEGMGLGLFIAKTLLQRSGAELTFANGRDWFSNRADPSPYKGAIVNVVWSADKITRSAAPVGKNEALEI